jgi:hypothetical protein
MEVTMQAAAWVAIVVPIVSVISLVVAIVGCAIAVKSYKKSRRLEFFQRRDKLLLTISDLNAKTSEVHLISARFGIVRLNRTALVVDEKHAETKKTEIASLTRLRGRLELLAERGDAAVDALHAVCSGFTTETDAIHIEKLIGLVQAASDEAKRYNEVQLSSLHTLETIDPMLKASLAEMHELEIRLAQLEREIKRHSE